MSYKPTAPTPQNPTAQRFATIRVDTSKFEEVFRDIAEKLAVNSLAIQQITEINQSIHELKTIYSAFSFNLLHTNKRLDDIAEQLAKINFENNLWGTVTKSVVPEMCATEVVERAREVLMAENYHEVPRETRKKKAKSGVRK